MPKRASGAPSAPTVPTDAPLWFHPYGSDNETVIRELLRRVADLEARLKAASIP